MTSTLTPQQIFDSLQQTIHGYMSALNGYTDEQFAQKPSESEWSLGQMYEHLYRSTNFFFLANTVRCLEQRKGQIGGDKNQYGDNLYKYNSFPPIKVKIPEVLRGPEPVAQDRANYAPHFAKILADAQKMIEAVAADDGQYKCIQPAFGWLNAHEWFHLMELHFRHHLRQQKELEEWLGISEEKK
jgi:DinB superfamily